MALTALATRAYLLSTLNPRVALQPTVKMPAVPSANCRVRCLPHGRASGALVGARRTSAPAGRVEPAGSAFRSNPARARFRIERQQLAHLGDSRQHTTFQVSGVGNTLLHAISQHEQAIWRPNAVHVLDEQTLSGKLQDV